MNLEKKYDEIKKKHTHDLMLIKSLDQYHFIFEKLNMLDKSATQLCIAIDGYSSSGKTTLAKLIALIFDANVIHIDDFFMPKEKVTSGIASHIDFERLKKEVIEPFQSKNKVVYQSFDCKSQSLSKTITLDDKHMIIIEGAYSIHPKIDINYDFKIFLKVNRLKQLIRIYRRNGYRELFNFIKKWIPKEHVYFNHYSIEEKADYMIRT
ncbi:MAG: hypothetical protein JXC31_03850 [Acholeplasmataceae bacterium]|nr:hypothetical protein [Acholeplasmataceae bacterium]